jgi:Putative auto-transporter adhesin, head GIN domain
MKRVLLLAFPLALTGCAHLHVNLGHSLGGFQGTKGNGKPQEVSRTVADFDRIEVGSSFQVEATEGPLSPVKVSADSNLLSQIKTEVKNRTLKVWVEGPVSTSSPQKISFSTPRINSLVASGATETNLKLASNHAFNLDGSGASKVNVKGTVSSLDCELSGASRATFGNLAMSRLDASLSGASELSIKGSADEVVAELSGASVISGGLRGKRAKVNMSGSSSAKFGPFEKVSKDLSGASNASFGN